MLGDGVGMGLGRVRGGVRGRVEGGCGGEERVREGQAWGRSSAFREHVEKGVGGWRP